MSIGRCRCGLPFLRWGAGQRLCPDCQRRGVVARRPPGKRRAALLRAPEPAPAPAACPSEGSAARPSAPLFPRSVLEVAPAMLESMKEAVLEGKGWGGNPQVGFDLYTLTGPLLGVACRAREAGLNPPRGATLWRRCRQDFAGVWHLYKWSCEAGQKSGWVLDTNPVCEQLAALEGDAPHA